MRVCVCVCLYTVQCVRREGEGLLQVAVDFEAVVARICNHDMSVRGESQTLRAVQRVPGCVDVGQEGAAAIKHLREREINTKSVYSLAVYSDNKVIQSLNVVYRNASVIDRLMCFVLEMICPFKVAVEKEVAWIGGLLTGYKRTSHTHTHKPRTLGYTRNSQ